MHEYEGVPTGTLTRRPLRLSVGALVVLEEESGPCVRDDSWLRTSQDDPGPGVPLRLNQKRDSPDL